MNAKIKKIDTEYEKNAARIAELQTRQKELEKQRTEYENLDIIGLVRSMGVTPEELAAIMQAARQNPAAPATTEKEEPDYAETENDYAGCGPAAVRCAVVLSAYGAGGSGCTGWGSCSPGRWLRHYLLLHRALRGEHEEPRLPRLSNGYFRLYRKKV